MSRKKRYNILFLMTDQHRADHVGFLPGSRLSTPNIDRIAEGVGFSNCVSVNPICTPARTALLTGKYTHQIGTLSMSGDLSREHPTYLRALQDAGYWTAGVGKLHWMQGPWNAGRGAGYDLVALKPEVMKYGFDYLWEVSGKQLAWWNNCDYCEHLKARGLLEQYRDHVESRGKNSPDPAKTTWSGEPWPFDEATYVDVVTGSEIVKAIDARPADQPFCIFGSFCGPHKPYDPPASSLNAIPADDNEPFLPGEDEMDSATRARLRRVRRAYKAMIMCVDTQIGEVIDKLDREGLLDETIVVFTSDHGEMLGDHNRMSKMQPWRESVIVPTAIRHPDHLLGRTCHAPIEITDLTASILDFAGLNPQRALARNWPAFHNRVPCRSLAPIICGDADSIRDYAFSECRGEWQMIQTARWKYIRYLNQSPTASAREELYDLVADPHEQENLIDNRRHLDILDDLRSCRTRTIDATPPAQTSWVPRQPWNESTIIGGQDERKDA